MKKRLLLLLAAMSLQLASCSSDKDAEDKEKAEQEQKTIEAARAVDTYKPRLICPQVAILRELEIVRDFGGEKPGRTSLVAAAKMKDIAGDCSYQEDGIDISFTLDLIAQKGPRLSGKRADFPYFIAVVDPEGRILNKNEMTAGLKFSGDKTFAEDGVPLHVFIPLAKDKNQTGRDYRVLAGFQLTQEQLNELREREKKQP